MQKLLLSLLVACCGYSYAHNLIFVHLGGESLPCIFTAMKQARFFNQECPIYLLTDQNTYRFFKSRALFFQEEHIRLVDMDLIPMTVEHESFRRECKIDASITEGFWVYASERFFTLLDFIEHQKLENVVHLESDTMLYMDLEELVPRFEALGVQIAAPFQSLVGCIPCFVFIKDKESLSLLANHMISEMRAYEGPGAHIRVNDMQTLASFYRKWGSSYLFPLPTLMPEYAKYYRKRKSIFGEDNASPLSFLFMSAPLLPELLFDAAGLAIFINGNDRRYTPGRGPGTIHARCLFDPGKFSYFWGKDCKERAVPYLSFRGKSYRIVNLHFHSKMPEEYASYQANRADLP